MPPHGNTRSRRSARQRGPDPNASIKYAIAFLRESSAEQEEGYSPETQLEETRRCATNLGYVVPDEYVFTVTVKGRRLDRTKEYQAALELIHAGAVHVVFVWHFSRFWRKASARLAVLDEMDRLGVKLYSVTQGADKPGVQRGIHAIVDEEYVRDLARMVRPNRERAARSGTHCGRTMIGYKRVYREWDSSAQNTQGRKRKRRHPAGELVVDEALRWVIRDEIYGRYAAGGWSIRALTADLNSREDIPPMLPGHPWTADRIHYILRNATYYGGVPHNWHPVGEYERAEPDSGFVADGRHEPIVSKELWEQVQERMDRAGKHVAINRHPQRDGLGRGILRCHSCGAAMVAVFRRHEPHKAGQYECAARRDASNGCTATSYRIDVADEALLAQVRRLRGHDWSTDVERRLSGEEGTREAHEAEALKRELAQAERDMANHAAGVQVLAARGLQPEELAAFHARGQELATTIRSLKARLAQLSRRASRVPDLRALHKRLTTTEIPTVVDELVARRADPALREGATAKLRTLVTELVSSARMVERWPERKSSWLRLEVEWTEPVQTLLDASGPDEGLELGPEPPHPPIDPRRERARARMRRYYLKRKDRRQAQQVGTSAIL